jgi:hypothetical protein
MRLFLRISHSVHNPEVSLRKLFEKKKIITIFWKEESNKKFAKI